MSVRGRAQVVDGLPVVFGGGDAVEFRPHVDDGTGQLVDLPVEVLGHVGEILRISS
ncbi:hypothetical protein ACFQL0_18450 [Haloplanus litoreus]|uniref:hypothetical protein n=1 Tax=Haloplanus litoreus TaxID=767515 RepID=UPI003606FAEA